MARIKEVEIAGQSFRIASLNLEQVEEMFPKTAEERQALQNLPMAEQQDRVYKVICCGLNNALKGSADTEQWTKARIRQELDMITFQGLHIAILQHSGLYAPPEEVSEARGEQPAAATIM